jgi:hypothetical protein
MRYSDWKLGFQLETLKMKVRFHVIKATREIKYFLRCFKCCFGNWPNVNRSKVYWPIVNHAKVPWLIVNWLKLIGQKSIGQKLISEKSVCQKSSQHQAFMTCLCWHCWRKWWNNWVPLSMTQWAFFSKKGPQSFSQWAFLTWVGFLI